MSEFKTYIGQYKGNTFEKGGITKAGSQWELYKVLFTADEKENKFSVFSPLAKSDVPFNALVQGQWYEICFVATETVNKSGQSFIAKKVINFKPYTQGNPGFQQPLTTQQPVIAQPQQTLTPQPVVVPNQPVQTPTQPQPPQNVPLNASDDLSTFAETYRKQIPAGDWSKSHFIGTYIRTKDPTAVIELIKAFDEKVKAL